MFMLKLKNPRKKLKVVHKKMSNFMSNKFGLFRPLNLNCHYKLRMPAVEWPLRTSLKRDLISKSTRIPDLIIVSWICARQLIKPYSGNYLDCLISERYKFALFLAIKNIPYARHYKPRLIFFLTQFSLQLRLILHTIYVLETKILHFLSLKSAAYKREQLQIESGLWWRAYGILSRPPQNFANSVRYIRQK